MESHPHLLLAARLELTSIGDSGRTGCGGLGRSDWTAGVGFGLEPRATHNDIADKV